MNHHETRQREIHGRRMLQGRHLEQVRQLQHFADKPKGKDMTKQEWKKLQSQKRKASSGTDDVAGRHLPSGISGLAVMAMSKVTPVPKEKLRADAAAAWKSWSERNQLPREAGAATVTSS